MRLFLFVDSRQIFSFRFYLISRKGNVLFCERTIEFTDETETNYTLPFFSIILNIMDNYLFIESPNYSKNTIRHEILQYEKTRTPPILDNTIFVVEIPIQNGDFIGESTISIQNVIEQK